MVGDKCKMCWKKKGTDKGECPGHYEWPEEDKSRGKTRLRYTINIEAQIVKEDGGYYSKTPPAYLLDLVQRNELPSLKVYLQEGSCEKKLLPCKITVGSVIVDKVSK